MIHERYRAAWDALCATQRFQRAQDDDNPVWLEQLAEISNKAKHECLQIAQPEVLFVVVHEVARHGLCVQELAKVIDSCLSDNRVSVHTAVEQVLWVPMDSCVYPWTFEVYMKADIHLGKLGAPVLSALSDRLFRHLVHKKTNVLTFSGKLSADRKRDLSLGAKNRKSKCDGLVGLIKVTLAQFYMDTTGRT